MSFENPMEENISEAPVEKSSHENMDDFIPEKKKESTPKRKTLGRLGTFIAGAAISIAGMAETAEAVEKPTSQPTTRQVESKEGSSWKIDKDGRQYKLKEIRLKVEGRPESIELHRKYRDQDETGPRIELDKEGKEHVMSSKGGRLLSSNEAAQIDFKKDIQSDSHVEIRRVSMEGGITVVTYYEVNDDTGEVLQETRN